MLYKSSISIFNKVILYGIIILLIGVIVPSLYCHDKIGMIVSLLINGLCICLLFWLLLDTKYTINDKELKCQSGPFKKTIHIETVKKIEFHDGIIVPVSWKLALDTKGIIITYNKFDTIYISPKQNKKFLESLLTINPNIQIINLKNEF